jgi:hypothetical protein
LTITFFFDRQISIRIARMIAHFERVHTVVHQDDDGRFSPTDLDVDIITTIAADDPKPVWITADLAQRKHPIERAALGGSGMTMFFFKRFIGQNQSPHFQSLKVLGVWPSIVKQAARVKVPTAFEIPFGSIGVPRDKIDSLGPTAELFK